MAKIKERKSESWKPGLFHDDGFISKNKKRKDKRMSLNLSAKKIDTDEFIPIKKSALAFKKTKDSLNSTPSKFLSPALDKKHTPKKKDTPMPLLVTKKQSRASMLTPNSRKLSFADTSTSVSRKLNGTPKLKNDFGSAKKNKEVAGTPRVKSELAATPKPNLEPIIKSSLKKKAQKFIDHEAEEGEEPVTDKEVKPYVKGQKRKSISFKFDEKEIYSDSDQSDDSDDSEVTSPRGFLDEEASEGEETGASDTDESDNGEDDEDDDGEDSDTFESFLADDSEDDEEGSDVSDEEDDDSTDAGDEEDDDGSDDSDEAKQPSKMQPKKLAPLSQKKSKAESDSDDDEKPDVKTTAKPTTSAPNQIKKEKTKVIEPSVKKLKTEEKVQKIKKEEKKPTQENTPAKAANPPPSPYSGFIKYLPNSITSDRIKTALASALSPEHIVSIVLKKNNTKGSNRCFIYVLNEDSLDKLENKIFTIANTTFKVYKARENKKIVETRPLAFLPRVPLAIDNEKLKSIIESDIGAGNVLNLRSKKENDVSKTRNVIVELADVELLKKIVYKGSYTYKGVDIVVRQAFESGFSIPIYKAVLANIPENTTEVVLKKAIEMKLGNGSVISVKRAYGKKSFAFVILNNEQLQKKLLEPSTEISIKGTKLNIFDFKPRRPKKRGPSKKKNKEAPATKKQKTDQSSPKPESKKSNKKFKKKKSIPPTENSTVPATETQPTSQKKSQPSKSVKKNSKKKNQSLKQSQNSSPQKPKPQQQQNTLSPSSPSKNKKAKNQVPDKKANLNNKLEAKKNKMKNKKNKKKQADTSI